MHLRLLAPLAFSLLASPALGDPTPAELDAARTACRDAFLAQDAEVYLDAAATMIAWGEVSDADMAREVELCLAFAEVLEGVDLEDARVRAVAATGTEASDVEPTAPADDDGRLADYLVRANSADADMAALAADIAADETFLAAPGDDRDALEAALNAYVAPIPAARAQQNLTAYQALIRVNPEEPRYVERAARYEGALEAERAQLERTARQLEDRLIRTVEAFDGSSWARHPSSPRYQDIRSYVTLYLLESGSGRQSMELFFNYTSRNGWLFVQSASINIDGQTRRLPVPRWFRDNDTEIWEFGSIIGSDAFSIAREIAGADRVVIRFTGQQFYDDYVVTDTDKRVLREMLAMWEVISAE